MLIKFGLEYYLNKKFAVRTGFAFFETQVPDHMLSPSYPDEDGHKFWRGLGCKIGNWIVDGFYIDEIYDNRKVNKDILSGEYKNTSHFIGMSLGYKFYNEEGNLKKNHAVLQLFRFV